MKKVKLIFKYCFYYVIGLISFSIIAFITQRVTIAILLRVTIDPIQDLYNLSSYIIAYASYYLVAYTLLFIVIMYGVRKYDKYVVNKLNEKLEQYKNMNTMCGGEINGER